MAVLTAQYGSCMHVDHDGTTPTSCGWRTNSESIETYMVYPHAGRCVKICDGLWCAPLPLPTHSNGRFLTFVRGGRSKGFLAAHITHGTSVPYVVAKDGRWRFLGKLAPDATADTPVVLAWGGAKMKAARHLTQAGVPDRRYPENQGARLMTTGPHAGSWRIPL